MQYQSSKGFEKILRRLHPNEKMEVQRNVDALVRAFEARSVPIGAGLKKLSGHLWEFRISLALRVLFEWEKNIVTFLFIGNHNEVQQFLRQYIG